MYAVAKCAVLLLAVLGYAMFYQKRKLPLCFFPIVAASGMSIAVYIPGLIGLLKPACYVVVLLGLLAFLRFFDTKKLVSFFSDWSILYVICSLVWLYVITRGEMLSDFDEGTHWYRICKSMNYEHAFPSTPDIFFYDYVPGCQVWVYLVTRFIGFSIPNCLFAQNALNVFCIAGLFAAIQNAKRFEFRAISTLAIAGAAVLLCCMSVGTYSLLVDTQLGLIAMAALLMMLDQGEKYESVFLIGVVMSFLVLIKNSAWIFILIISVWAIIRYRYEPKACAVRVSVWLGIPLTFYLLYKLRCAMVYPNSMSAQSVSLERFAIVLAGKNAGDAWQLIKGFFKKLVLCEMDTALTMYGCVSVLSVLYFSMKEAKDEEGMMQGKQALKGCLATLAIYTLSLWATYLFSFSASEAERLSGFWRYYGTVLIFTIGLTVYTGLCLVERLRFGKALGMGILLIFVLAMPGAYSKKYIQGSQYYSLPEDYRSDIWRAVERAIPQNNHYTDESYLVFWNQDDFFGGSRDNERVGYIMGAWLRSNRIGVISEWDIRAGLDEKTLQSIKQYKYVANISDMTRHTDLLSPYLGDTALSIGLHEMQP